MNPLKIVKVSAAPEITIIISDNIITIYNSNTNSISIYISIIYQYISYIIFFNIFYILYHINIMISSQMEI